MNPKPSGTWGQWISSGLIMSFFRLARLLPFRMRGNLVASALKGSLGKLTGYRKRIAKNLTHIYPEMTQSQKNEITDQVLDNSGRTFLENLYPEQFQKNITDVHFFGEGIDALKKAKAENRGIVLVSGHFGNHEALRLSLWEMGIRVGAIYRPMSNPYFNKHYYDSIQICGRTGPLFPVGKEGTQGYIEALRQGEAMILLIDISVATGEKMDFMGQPAMTSTAAAAFALRTNSLYLPYFTLRNEDRVSFSVELAAPIEHSTALEMTAEANRLLKIQINKDPGNWFWVHNRWKPWA